MNPKIDFRRLPDLASRGLGGSVVFTNDDFYADVHSLIAAGPARHDPAEFASRGKVYDGWETRRRRDRAQQPGAADAPDGDFVIVRLAVPGIVRGVNIDTLHFAGNYPPAASLQTTTVLGYPDPAELLAAEWTTVLDHVELDGDSANVVPVEADGPDRLVTHVRLVIHPDGGVARLRVHGEVVADPRRLAPGTDLAALAHGGLIEDCSNLFYASPNNVLMPGVSRVMSDGWETARRRADGNEWLVLRLAAPGMLREVVVDTSRFVGNAPAAARLADADSGAELLPRTRLQPDLEHRFRLPAAASAVQRVRLDIYPDGGLSRLRLHGTVPEALREALARRWLALLPPEQAAAVDAAEFFG